MVDQEGDGEPPYEIRAGTRARPYEITATQDRLHAIGAATQGRPYEITAGT